MKSPEQFLPLTEVTYFILLSLRDTPKHGYAIIKDISMRSEGRVSLSTGTLYGALKRLLTQNLIERLDDELVTEHNSLRETKPYRLTLLGKNVLEAEIQRLTVLLRAVGLSTK